MPSPVLVLRPEPGNAQTCRAARALGLDACPAPLFAYAPHSWVVPLDSYDGLLAGSAAVFALGGVQLTALHALPVVAVGPATARAARAEGFTVAATGSGGMQPVAAALPPGRYLRLAGAARVALDPPPGVVIDDVVVYAAEANALSDEAQALIRRKPVLALLHSAEAARHFGRECDSHGLSRDGIALACMAPRIASAAGDGWQDVQIATNPDDEALLSLARQMCQTV
jgi:uroporphyrinogen-III synthase